MIEISTDPDGTLYVRWAAGGIWTVLSEDGCVGRCERGDYDDGFAAGYDEAREEARDAVQSISAPKKKAIA